jgi:nicotinate phosphoribosyltransferase
MPDLSRLYGHSLALLTDLYQLTMAYGYWRCGLAEREAVFHLTFREHPFGGQYAVGCGLAYVVDLLDRFRFDDADLAYLQTLTDSGGHALFPAPFLDYLRDLTFTCDVDAIPEGTCAFAHEPLLRVRGPLMQSQIIETPLLNAINFQTLIATKASRVCRAAGDRPVLEFGLRRAQGIDGGLAASRAAYIGGCAATSNVLAGKLFGIPVRGTHGHSWVMAFDTELQAFEAYARAMPGNCVFLVDTYGTSEGIEHAVTVAGDLRRRGHQLAGIRLDSGDPVQLSCRARRVLDAAGLEQAAIVVSGDLDEYQIERLLREGAAVDVWGVGTRLATAYDQPALGGVYKLSAIRSERGEWEYKLKRSDDPAKQSAPGILQIRRFCDAQGQFQADVIYDEPTGLGTDVRLVTPTAETPVPLPAPHTAEDLLVPVFRAGRRVCDPPLASDSRRRTLDQLQRLPPGVLRMQSPEPYLVGSEPRLHRCKTDLLRRAARFEPGCDNLP